MNFVKSEGEGGFDGGTQEIGVGCLGKARQGTGNNQEWGMGKAITSTTPASNASAREVPKRNLGYPHVQTT